MDVKYGTLDKKVDIIRVTTEKNEIIMKNT